MTAAPTTCELLDTMIEHTRADAITSISMIKRQFTLCRVEIIMKFSVFNVQMVVDNIIRFSIRPIL